MNIFLDESGLFAVAPNPDSWNCVSAYVAPEIENARMRLTLNELKLSSGVHLCDEIKLRQITEKNYIEFLEMLGQLDGVLFAAALDSGKCTVPEIISHRDEQALKIIKHKSKMLHQEARHGIQHLSDQVKSLSPQLYVQLVCQIILVSDILNRGILYFVQQHPKTLGRFCWRVDQKDENKTEFEKAFMSLLPGILQTISLAQPLIMLTDADYSYFNRFEYGEGEKPTYLRDSYGIEINNDDIGINIGKIIREDFKFVDSKITTGVQIADLLSTGIRRCLRCQFRNNDRVAELLGNLMVQAYKGSAPIGLLQLNDNNSSISDSASNSLMIIQSRCRPMLRR